MIPILLPATAEWQVNEVIELVMFYVQCPDHVSDSDYSISAS